jgi:hypothetical protein
MASISLKRSSSAALRLMVGAKEKNNRINVVILKFILELLARSSILINASWFASGKNFVKYFNNKDLP